jgi:hypothetical protein
MPEAACTSASHESEDPLWSEADDFFDQSLDHEDV